MEIWKLSQVCDINPKKTVPLSPDTIITFIPMESVSTTGFVDYSQTISVSSIKSYSVFKNDDVLFAKITPCMENGKGAIVSNLLNGYGAGSTEFIVLRPHLEQITREWLFYFLSQKAFRLQCQGNMTGSAGQKRVPAKYLSECTIPVPPLPEQQRIVARIEELFSQLDAGVETLKKTKQQLEVYRQAVLKEAFEGKLTSMWRNQPRDISPKTDYESIRIIDPIYKDIAGDENEIHLDLPSTWLKLRIGDVFSVEVGATPSRQVPEYWKGNINWVSSGEVQFSHIYRTKEQITDEGLAHASTKIQPVGTVMLAMIGEGKTRGQAAILKVPAAHNQNTAAILVSMTPCQPEYLYYFFQLNYENTRRVGSGNNQKALNKERVRALHFPFASFDEQREMVSEIE